MNVGGLKISISSRMSNLSIYFNCVVVLAAFGVDGSDSVSGNDDSVVSEEISIGSFTMFGSPCVYECVVQ